MKMPFPLLEHHLETIAKFSPNAHTYAHTAKLFLETNGWNEDDYLFTLTQDDTTSTGVMQ